MLKMAHDLGGLNVVKEFYDYAKNNPGSVADYATQVGISYGAMYRILQGNEPRNLKIFLALRKFLDTKNNEKLSSQS